MPYTQMCIRFHPAAMSRRLGRALAKHLINMHLLGGSLQLHRFENRDILVLVYD